MEVRVSTVWLPLVLKTKGMDRLTAGSGRLSRSEREKPLIKLPTAKQGIAAGKTLESRRQFLFVLLATKKASEGSPFSGK